MHEREKSDPAIGAGKPTNKAEATSVADAAEPVEQRAGAKGNASGQSTHRIQSRERVSQALDRVRQARFAVTTQGGSGRLTKSVTSENRSTGSNVGCLLGFRQLDVRGPPVWPDYPGALQPPGGELTTLCRCHFTRLSRSPASVIWCAGRRIAQCWRSREQLLLGNRSADARKSEHARPRPRAHAPAAGIDQHRLAHRDVISTYCRASRISPAA